MLVDYGEVLTRLEEALGRHYRLSPSILNVPGVSVAVKLDPEYYLALRPSFGELLGKWAGVVPARVEETLTRTGNLVLGPDRSRYGEPLLVFEEGSATVLRLVADFVPAALIDRAVVMYGGEPGPLAVSGLRLVAGQRQALDAFFGGKTPLRSLAFGEPEAV
jgi:hypothetical protein